MEFKIDIPIAYWPILIPEWVALLIFLAGLVLWYSLIGYKSVE